MSKHRLNAPLVEVIAELRWDIVGSDTSIPGVFSLAPTDRAELFENSFDKFGDRVAVDHSHKERLVPPGFPLLNQQPAYRFTNRKNGEHNSLFQVGPGIFSAHAVPPYGSWDNFSKVLETGLRALLDSREGNADAPILTTNLRYVDAFRPNLTEGRSTNDFLKDILGITVNLPDVLLAQMATGAAPVPYAQIRIPMANGVVMHFSFGEGTVHGEHAIIMDTSISTTVSLPPVVDALMQAFNSAHEVIKGTFGVMTSKIEHLMPESED